MRKYLLLTGLLAGLGQAAWGMAGSPGCGAGGCGSRACEIACVKAQVIETPCAQGTCPIAGQCATCPKAGTCTQATCGQACEPCTKVIKIDRPLWYQRKIRVVSWDVACEENCQPCSDCTTGTCGKHDKSKFHKPMPQFGILKEKVEGGTIPSIDWVVEYQAVGKPCVKLPRPFSWPVDFVQCLGGEPRVTEFRPVLRKVSPDPLYNLPRETQPAIAPSRMLRSRLNEYEASTSKPKVAPSAKTAPSETSNPTVPQKTTPGIY